MKTPRFARTAGVLAALLLTAPAMHAEGLAPHGISHERIELALSVLGYNVKTLVAHDADKVTWYEVHAVKEGRRVIVVLDDRMTFVREYDYGRI